MVGINGYPRVAWVHTPKAGASWACSRFLEGSASGSAAAPGSEAGFVHPTISMQADLYKPMSRKYSSNPTCPVADAESSASASSPKRSCRSGSSSPSRRASSKSSPSRRTSSKSTRSGCQDDLAPRRVSSAGSRRCRGGEQGKGHLLMRGRPQSSPGSPLQRRQVARRPAVEELAQAGAQPSSSSSASSTLRSHLRRAVQAPVEPKAARQRLGDPSKQPAAEEPSQPRAQPQSCGGSPQRLRKAVQEAAEPRPGQLPLGEVGRLPAAADRDAEAAAEKGESASDADVWLVPSFLTAEHIKPLEELASMSILDCVRTLEGLPSLSRGDGAVLASAQNAGVAAPTSTQKADATVLTRSQSQPSVARKIGPCLSRHGSLPDRKSVSSKTETEPRRTSLRSCSKQTVAGSPTNGRRSSDLTNSRQSTLALGFARRVSEGSRPSTAGHDLPRRSSDGGRQGALSREPSKSSPSRRRSTKSRIALADLDWDAPPSPKPSPPPPPSDLVQLAKSMGIPLAIAKQAADLFKSYLSETRPDFDALRDGSLTPGQFREIFGSIKTGADISDEDLCEADADGDGRVNFQEFAFWYYCGGFSEQACVPREERRLRLLARDLSMSLDEVDRCNKLFKAHDFDGNGTIDYAEFAALMSVLTKVPSGLKWEDNRLQPFWREANFAGGSGLDFEAFLKFYSKHFRGVGGECCPFETIYTSIRPVTPAFAALGAA